MYGSHRSLVIRCHTICIPNYYLLHNFLFFTPEREVSLIFSILSIDSFDLICTYIVLLFLVLFSLCRISGTLQSSRSRLTLIIRFKSSYLNLIDLLGMNLTYSIFKVKDPFIFKVIFKFGILSFLLYYIFRNNEKIRT